MTINLSGYDIKSLAVISCFFMWCNSTAVQAKKVDIEALYIPLADHYAAIVAYDRYRGEMQHARFQLRQMGNWDLLRARFLQGEADIALVMAPLAMDMFQQHPSFRWIGLAHRDGNGLAVSHNIANELDIFSNRLSRKPDKKLAQVIKRMAEQNQKLIVGVPHVKSTHTLILYEYLRQHNLTMSLSPNVSANVLVRPIAPPNSPAFVLGQSNRSKPAAIEQSLPWIDVVETDNYGWVTWYSKDVIPSEKGHVECILLASEHALTSKEEALVEVFSYIKKAGEDIEKAREEGGQALDEIVGVIRKHIPAHSEEAILASLSNELKVINYRNLDTDVQGLEQIMNLAVKAGVLKQEIDITQFEKKL